ncbi:AMED_5909 family protein [Actinosynnema sp. CA-248983]
MSGAYGPERVLTASQLWTAAERATTLHAAMTAVLKAAPSVNAEPGEWLAHHQRAARVYRRVAEIDHDRHHEALAFGQEAENRASRLIASLPPQRTEPTL